MTVSDLTTREIHLVRRPVGEPLPSDFAIVERRLAEPAEGEFLIRQTWMSVDPAMRPRLESGYALGEPLSAFAIGIVERSRHREFPDGAMVFNRLGFRDLALSSGDGVTLVRQFPDLAPTAYLSVLGPTGFTAYGGLLRIAELRAGDEVFVSAAAGAVGSIAAQIARLKGCRVIGSTGSSSKARWLSEDLKLDAVIDYRAGAISEQLEAVTPDGLDIYFDNVGGDHLDAALLRMNPFGRVAICGMIAAYNEPGARLPVYNLARSIYSRVTLRGFVGDDFLDLRDEFEEQMSIWVRAGEVHWRETVVDGLDHAPDALIGLLRGDNIGKMIVRLAGAD